MTCKRCNGDRFISGDYPDLPDEPCPTCNPDAPSGAERVKAFAAGTLIAPTTTNVPARNKRVKALLLLTYPGVKVSVTAGNGTAYHWIYIKFDDRVGNPPGMSHDRVEDAIVDLIVGAGIHISTFNRSDDDRDFGKLPCINITMPHKAKVDLIRNANAATIAQAMRNSWPQATITETVTTSDCPLIRLEFPDGNAFHVTVTRARS